MILILKASFTTVADDVQKYFHCFSEKIRFDAFKPYFLRKIKLKIINVSSAAILLGLKVFFRA